MKKQLLLTIIILIIGFSSLIAVYQNNLRKKNIFGAEKIARINKKDLIFPANSEFKYYTELESSIDSTEERPWDGIVAHYHFNQDGLNDRFDYDTLKKKDTYRIITLGDSFTFGHYVDTASNWTELLEILLNENPICTNKYKFEVINLGNRGFDIPYIVKRYNDKGLKYHPNLIIWLESGS